MMPAFNEQMVIAGIALAASSGIPGLFSGRTRHGGERIATVLMGLAAVFGFAGALGAIVSGTESGISMPWSVPGGELSVRVDGISAMFLMQVFLIGFAGSVYGLGYWSQNEHSGNGQKLRLFYGLMVASMSTLLIARNCVLFLAGWEIMALCSFLTVTTEDEKPETRDAGYTYLIGTRFGTLCLFAMFALLAGATGTFDFGGSPVVAPPAVMTAVFLLGLAGFGLKAGVMPLHFWLPGAHANAPSHVSALMSGVLIKMGVYGLFRLSSLFAHPPLWWGLTILGLGVVSGILGIGVANGQRDLKRMLAYSSVENIGIIFLGLGLALIGRSAGRPELVLLGFAAAIFHVWNHGLFKALLFLSAGSLIHATHTHTIDRLGGLLKTMPSTGLCFLTGAVAVCGLPPLNGFVSEILLYLGLFKSLAVKDGGWWLVTASAIPVLALVGALAVASFAKVFGVIFLGQPRSPAAVDTVESGRTMIVPMAVLAACCVFVGFGAIMIAPVLDGAAGAWAPELPLPSLTAAVPLGAFALTGLVLSGFAGIAWLVLKGRLDRSKVASAVTWDCGYAEPRPAMQYTSSSFAQMLTGMFSVVLRPRITGAPVDGPFPAKTAFRSEVPEPVLDLMLVPSGGIVARFFEWMRWFQRGSVQQYIAYVFLTLILLSLWR